MPVDYQVFPFSSSGVVFVHPELPLGRTIIVQGTDEMLEGFPLLPEFIPRHPGRDESTDTGRSDIRRPVTEIRIGRVREFAGHGREIGSGGGRGAVLVGGEGGVDGAVGRGVDTSLAPETADRAVQG